MVEVCLREEDGGNARSSEKLEYYTVSPTAQIEEITPLWEIQPKLLESECIEYFYDVLRAHAVPYLISLRPRHP